MITVAVSQSMTEFAGRVPEVVQIAERGGELGPLGRER